MVFERKVADVEFRLSKVDMKMSFFPYPLLHKCSLPQATTAPSDCHYAPRDASDNGGYKCPRAYSLPQSWTEQLGVNGIMGTISE